MNKITTFAKRLKEYRDTNNYTLADISKRTGVPAQTLNRYELNQRIPKIDIANEIADSLSVNSLWLQGYDVPMYAQEEKSNIPAGVRIPVLGHVAAGIPIEAIEDIIDYEEIPQAMAKNGEYFGLRIRGNSMEPRILEGDVVIVRKQPDVESGEIAVVLVNGDEATCKRVIKSDAGITLIALNVAAYPPHFYTAQEVASLPVTIVGKVVELRGKV